MLFYTLQIGLAYHRSFLGNLLSNLSTVAVIVGEDEQKCLDNILPDFEKEPTHPRYNYVIQANYLSGSITKVFIWCTTRHFDIGVACPARNCPLIFNSSTRNVQNKAQKPRLIHDLHGNILLVQSTHRCK